MTVPATPPPNASMTGIMMTRRLQGVAVCGQALPASHGLHPGCRWYPSLSELNASVKVSQAVDVLFMRKSVPVRVGPTMLPVSGVDCGPSQVGDVSPLVLGYVPGQAPVVHCGAVAAQR